VLSADEARKLLNSIETTTFDRSARPGADRGNGLHLRPGGRSGGDAGGRLFRAPQPPLAEAP
jgi:hypothetical protein